MISMGLVACGKAKFPNTSPARLLYMSLLIREASAYCAATYDVWYILSAKHGLLSSCQRIDPNDFSLTTMGKLERREWADRVLGQFQERGIRDACFLIDVGERYAEHLSPALDANRPLLGLGIGQQLAW